MPQYDVILPEGHVILRDRATGRMLRLSAESGPLKLGTVELGFAFAPEALDSLEGLDGGNRSLVKADQRAKSEEAPASVPPPAPAPAPAAAPAPLSAQSESEAAFERMRRLPPGFGLETELPFLSPAAPMPPAPADDGAAVGPAPLRTLDAPLESLTQEEFETSLTSLIRARDEAGREAEFLAEIEAEPEDVQELRDRRHALDQRIARVAHRFEEWRRLQKKVDAQNVLRDA